MGSPEDKAKHQKRIRIKSKIAKDLGTNKYRQRIVEDKKGREHDLSKISHRELVELIQELDEEDNCND